MEEMVSIIVPVYRAAPYIAETIAMVMKQTYRNWELLLVDDYSPDNSAEIIQNIIEKQSDRALSYSCGAGRICLIRKEKNEGAAKARNTGIEREGSGNRKNRKGTGTADLQEGFVQNGDLYINSHF